MAPSLLGWESTLKSTDPPPTNKRELLVVFLHWNLIRADVKCLGAGEEKTIGADEISSELLPSNWKESEKYSLRYVYNKSLYLFFVMFTDNTAVFNILNVSNMEMNSVAIDVEKTIQKLEGPIDTMIPSYEEVIHHIKKNLLEGVLNKKTASTPSQTEQGEAETSHRDRVPSYSPLLCSPPRSNLVYPQNFDPYGQADLNPFGIGGGMIFPHRPPNRLQVGRGPRPGLPRFDPLGPPDIERHMGPSPDHLRMPDNDDMYL